MCWVIWFLWKKFVIFVKLDDLLASFWSLYIPSPLFSPSTPSFPSYFLSRSLRSHKTKQTLMCGSSVLVLSFSPPSTIEHTNSLSLSLSEEKFSDFCRRTTKFMPKDLVQDALESIKVISLPLLFFCNFFVETFVAFQKLFFAISFSKPFLAFLALTW